MNDLGNLVYCNGFVKGVQGRIQEKYRGAIENDALQTNEENGILCGMDRKVVSGAMSFEWAGEYPQSKHELYPLLQSQLMALMAGERDAVANMANASALLGLALANINWAGFYVTQGSELVLGPFQGKPACIRIPFGKGVCGAAAQTGQTQLVPDVHAFPGHIACDTASRAEIVVPLRWQNKLVGVLDIDSPIPSRFDLQDRAGLEAFAQRLVQSCDW